MYYCNIVVLAGSAQNAGNAAFGHCEVRFIHEDLRYLRGERSAEPLYVVDIE